MTYGGFLIIFIGIPLVIFAALTAWDQRRGLSLPTSLRNMPAHWPLLIHVLVAVIYTTPWDNYLVANGVWYYPPERVLGLRLGWVPIEEYTFFVVQTLLSGLWLLWLARRLPEPPALGEGSRKLRLAAVALAGLIWLPSVAIWLSGWKPFTYMGLILGWALPPIALQLYFGADILWRRRALLGLALGATTLYLACTDFVAIADQIWTIAPGQSLQVYLGGVLPLEEFVFFFVTNVLIVFGMTLALDLDSRPRWHALLNALRTRRGLSATLEETHD